MTSRITDNDIQKLTRGVDTRKPARVHESEAKAAVNGMVRAVAEASADEEDFMANIGDLLAELFDDSEDDEVTEAIRASRNRSKKRQK